MITGMKRLSATLAVLLLAALGAVPALAAQPHGGTLTVRCGPPGEGLAGAGLSLYRVAGLTEAGEAAGPAEGFRGAGVDLSRPGDGTAGALAGYVGLHGIPAGERGTTGPDGSLRWSGLAPGLYLLTGQRRVLEGWAYDPPAVLLTVPDPRKEGESRDVTVQLPCGRTRLEAGEPLSCQVRTEWRDGGAAESRPRSVTVYLLRNGRPAGQSVTLSEGNGWSHLWEGLRPEVRWSVAVEPVKGYAGEIVQEGSVFVVTNTRVGESAGVGPVGAPAGARAGRTAPGRLWWPAALLTAGSGGLLLGMLLRRRSFSEPG